MAEFKKFPKTLYVVAVLSDSSRAVVEDPAHCLSSNAKSDTVGVYGLIHTATVTREIVVTPTSKKPARKKARKNRTQGQERW
ncbi:MAG: hypothetical protein KAV00_02005 [Phycisphaerae bacterium]|nr:hypothetical protein [Phycisphaerae bacterium]